MTDLLILKWRECVYVSPNEKQLKIKKYELKLPIVKKRKKKERKEKEENTAVNWRD